MIIKRFFVECVLVYVRDLVKTQVIHTGWIIQIHRNETYKHVVYSHVVESELSSHSDVKYASSFGISPHDHDGAHYTLRRTCIYLFIILRLICHVKMFDGEWMHETCLGEDFFNVMNMLEDRIGQKLLSKWDLWDFFHPGFWGDISKLHICFFVHHIK